jgi:hypothetical protein
VGELSHRAVIRIAPFASRLELTVAKFVRFAEPAYYGSVRSSIRVPPADLSRKAPGMVGSFQPIAARRRTRWSVVGRKSHDLNVIPRLLMEFVWREAFADARAESEFRICLPT